MGGGWGRVYTRPSLPISITYRVWGFGLKTDIEQRKREGYGKLKNKLKEGEGAE